MERNRVLYKATLLSALSLSRTCLLLELGFSKGMYTIERMLLLNGAIANSFDQRNKSCIFVDIETNFDSPNTIMTTSDAVKLVIRCKLSAWIKDYIVRLVTNQRTEAKFQGRVSGALGFWTWHPEVSLLRLFLFNIIVKHPIPAEFLPRSTAASDVDMLIATSKSRVHVTQLPLCSLNYDCK